MLVSEAQILDVLRRQNSWWQTGTVSNDLAPAFRRLAYYEVQSFLSIPKFNRAVLLTGARRVGKTVILHQLAQEAIKKGIASRKVLYVTFEDLTLTQANLREILDLYEKHIEKITDETLILLDELHYASNWSRWLMTILREYPHAKFVATGSAAVLLRDKEKNESGVGRWTTVHVPTLSFFEYIQLRGSTIPILSKDLTLNSLLKSGKKEQETILSRCIPLQREFNRYLLQGGFPASISQEYSLAIAQRLLREDVIDKALKRDMAHLYGVRSLGELDQIFVYLCFNLGSIVEKSTLAKELKVAAVTVENHLQRLEDAHLIYRLPPINLKGKKSLKPRPKIYVADPSLRNAVILRGDGVFSNEDELGTLIEGCIFKHLYAFYYPDRPRFGYWRSSQKDKEVDFVLDFPNGFRVACEVKYRENAKFDLKDSLNELIEKSKESNQIFLVTKNTTDYGMTEDLKIFQIPAFVFCYLLGHVELQRWLKNLNPA